MKHVVQYLLPMAPKFGSRIEQMIYEADARVQEQIESDRRAALDDNHLRFSFDERSLAQRQRRLRERDERTRSNA